MNMRLCSPLRQGFTLMEIMIAITIIGIMVAVAVPAYQTYQRRASRSATVQNLQVVKDAINFFKTDTGKYPAKLDELASKPSGDAGKGWQGPYIERIPNDGWNNEFVYKVTKGGKHPYELYSYGPEGEGAADDSGRVDIWEI